MAEAFAVGAVVRLKSGGPPMTITQENTQRSQGSLTVNCAWFADTKVEHGTFPPAALETVKPEDIP